VRRRAPRLARGRRRDGTGRRHRRIAMARRVSGADDDPAAPRADPAAGRMSAPVVNLDFVGRRAPLTLLSGVLLLLGVAAAAGTWRSEEHTSELQSPYDLV